MTAASQSQTKLIPHCIKHLRTGYHYLYGDQAPEYAALIDPIATLTLDAIAGCDAPYHNLEHTIQVVLVGQEILYGKHLCEEPISPAAWLHFIVSLLCHDIGYLKGICRQDRPDELRFATGIDDGCVSLPATATGASLTPLLDPRHSLFGNDPDRQGNPGQFVWQSLSG